jgi:excisionase family DNA binding protein
MEEQINETLNEILKCVKELGSKVETISDRSVSSNMEVEDKEFLTKKETAEYLSCDITTINNWSNSGKLKKYGLGRRVYYKRTEVLAAMKKL